MPAIALPDPPAAKSWNPRPAVQWGKLGNDMTRDSAVAAADYLMMCWSANASGTPWSFTGQDAIADHKKFKGVGDDANFSDILDGWRLTGLRRRVAGLARTVKIDDYALLQVNDADQLQKQIQQSIALMGGCCIALNLPKYANVYNAAGDLEPQGQMPPDWTPSITQLKAKGDLGKEDKDANQCVVAIGYGAGGLEVVTWGVTTTMSWDFFFEFYQGAWTVLCVEAWASQGQTPDGRSVDLLRNQFAALAAAGN